MPACSGRDKRRWEYTSLDQTLRLALPEDLSTSNADERREAVAFLAEGPRFQQEEVFYVLDAVARSDPVTQIRCIAVRGLSRYEDDRPVGTLLTILQANQGSDQALPPDDDLRWEALRGLNELESRGVLDDQQRAIARDLCIKLAQPESSRSVRLEAIETLGFFKDLRVFQPLIRSVRDEDFAIAERAELSLIALTGVTHDFDADAWEEWVANVADPFENSGQVPQTTRPAPPSWWDKKVRAVRRALKLGTAD
jgi:hypothetical protein